MGLSTESQSKLEAWLDSLISKVCVTILIAGWTALMLWLTTDIAGQVSTLCSGVLLLLLARLGLAYLRVRKDRDSLIAGFSITEVAESEPELSELAYSVLCLLVNVHPQSWKPHEIQERLNVDADDLSVALEQLRKTSYVRYDSGAGIYGERNDPETYQSTRDGRLFVRARRTKR